MPLYQVTMSEDTKRVFVAYVEAPSQEIADDWASMIEDGSTVGACVDESTCGSVDEILEIDEVPPGRPVGKAT
jgi:hypothetical protein